MIGTIDIAAVNFMGQRLNARGYPEGSLSMVTVTKEDKLDGSVSTKSSILIGYKSLSDMYTTSGHSDAPYI